MTTVTAEILSDSTAVVLQADAQTRAGHALSIANQMIVTAITYEDASRFLAQIKREAKDIDTGKQSVLRPLLEATAALRNGFRPAEEALTQAEQVIKGKLVTYTTELERQRREAERIAQEAQRKEEARLQALADKAVARGDLAKAEAFAARAETVALSPVAVESAPTAGGLSFATTWSAEVTDLRALAAAVLAGTVPEMAIAPDMKYINATARATKGAMRWAGVKWIETKTARQRV